MADEWQWGCSTHGQMQQQQRGCVGIKGICGSILIHHQGPCWHGASCILCSSIGDGCWIAAVFQALKLRGGDRDCLAARSKCYLCLGDTDNALKDAEASLQNDKTFSKVKSRKGEEPGVGRNRSLTQPCRGHCFQRSGGAWTQLLRAGFERRPVGIVQGSQWEVNRDL